MSETHLQSHTIIAGFGIPGRAVADMLMQHHRPFVVIERNREVCDRCAQGNIPILFGDVLSKETLQAAGIERANLLVLAIPDDAVCLEAIRLARRLRPSIRIIARCVFTSAGLQAMAHGADETVIAEQVVAEALARIVEQGLGVEDNSRKEAVPQ